MAFRSGEATETLDQQVAFKRAHEAAEREQLLAEKEHMRQLWDDAERESKEQAEREKIAAAVERKKVDAFMYIQREERERKEREDKEADRQRAIAQALESNEALKMDMARKAESDAELI